jgi:hypothetical protein
MGEEQVTLSMEDALKMQDDLIKGYISEGFQTKIWDEFKKAGDDNLKKTTAKAECCQMVQFEVIPKYGFAADRKGVQASLKSFTPEMNAHPQAVWRNELMQYLIDPSIQKNIADRGLPAPKGVATSRLRAPHPDDWPEDSGKVWLVVGGGEKGGIVVRREEDTKSAELKDRLGTDALVEQVELAGERLKYQKMDGNGPDIGWVSISFKGKPLVIPLWHETAPSDVETFKVVHDRVAKRAEPSKDGKMLAAAKKGESLKGVVMEEGGVPWLRVREKTLGSAEAADVFVMIDGTSVGLGTLLEKA